MFFNESSLSYSSIFTANNFISRMLHPYFATNNKYKKATVQAKLRRKRVTLFICSRRTASFIFILLSAPADIGRCNGFHACGFQRGGIFIRQYLYYRQ